MMASTRAPGAMVKRACSSIARSSAGERSSSGAPFPTTEGAGLLLIIFLPLRTFMKTARPFCQLPPRAARVSSVLELSALDARRAAFGERPHLLDRRHRRVAGEGRQERAVRPAELQGLLGRLAG